MRNVCRQHRPTCRDGASRPSYDVELLLPIANLVPDSRIGERGAVDFLHFQDIGVKLSRAFQVLNSNEKMMQVGFAHGRHILVVDLVEEETLFPF